MTIVGQTKSGSGVWHVHGSPDGRWAVGDDFARNLWLIDRRSREMTLLTTGHKTTAADHVHPSFHPDGTRIQIQSAMLSADNRSMNICIVPVPQAWLQLVRRQGATGALRPEHYGLERSIGCDWGISAQKHHPKHQLLLRLN